MLVFKWGNDLAVLFPQALVDQLGLKEGGELNVVAATPSQAAVEKVDKRAEFVRKAEQFRFPLPEGYKFDRDEANER